MERFDIRTDHMGRWHLAPREDGEGGFCYAVDALRCRAEARWWKVAALAWMFMCVSLMIFIAGHKHDPQPVQTVSEEEHRAVVQQEQQAQAEKATLRKQLADEHARRVLADKMIKESNANNAKLVQQLKEVQASVPPLPVIQKAIHEEAKTDAGFKAAVLRNFGPIKVEVRE